MRLDFKVVFTIIILIPLLICILAIINGKSLDQRYYCCLEQNDEQQCQKMFK